MFERHMTHLSNHEMPVKNEWDSKKSSIKKFLPFSKDIFLLLFAYW